MLIKTVNTERIFFNKLSIYRKNDSERINKDFIITETSRVHKSAETRRCKAFDHNNRMRLEKILFALASKEV